MTTSVLFIIDTEGEEFYSDIEKKLVSEFEDCTVSGECKKFKPICVSSNCIKAFNFEDKNSMIKLLCRVNCMSVVYIKHRVDSVTNTENIMMQINYGVLHPDFTNAHHDILQLDMRNLSEPIRRRKFEKASTIDEMTFAAKQLNIICHYIVGLVMLLSGKHCEAYNRFHMLKNMLSTEIIDGAAPGFSIVLDNRLAVACMALVNDDFDAFYLEKSRAALEDINAKLDEINTIMPNTYDYFQGKAYYYVASNSDIASAKECIKMCKLDKKRNSWRYSEAFLAAYEGRAAMSIYKKYSQAFHYDQDLNRIVDYIEYILEKEPDKVGLHLAAGLVYNEIDQKSLAKEHLDCYFAVSADDRIRRVFADKKIWKEDKAA